jgi:hypothetical protein
MKFYLLFITFFLWVNHIVHPILFVGLVIKKTDV